MPNLVALPLHQSSTNHLIAELHVVIWKTLEGVLALLLILPCLIHGVVGKPVQICLSYHVPRHSFLLFLECLNWFFDIQS